MTDDSRKRENAEALAIQALGFVAADPELLPRFLAIIGHEAPVQSAEAAPNPASLPACCSSSWRTSPPCCASRRNRASTRKQVTRCICAAPPFGDESHDRSA